MIENRIDISDDPLIGCHLDSPQEVFFCSPLGSLGSFLIELAEVPDIIAAELSGSYEHEQKFPHIVACTITTGLVSA